MFSDSMMLGGGRQAAFSIANSVRLDGVADYFSRTPSVAGNRQTWTFSCWVKRAEVPNHAALFACEGDVATYIYLLNDGSIDIQSENNVIRRLKTTSLYRDPIAWGHLVVAYDTIQPIETNRIKVYWNGAQITSFSIALYPPQDYDGGINQAAEHRIGQDFHSNYASAYVTHPVFVNNVALDPSAFGETDPVTGSWRPKRPSIADYGTNGFHLDFKDVANLGLDTSGNDNHWNPISLGATDVMADSPTNNFCTWSNVSSRNCTLSNGALTGQTPAGFTGHLRGTIGVSSGVWCWEITPSEDTYVAIPGIVGETVSQENDGNYENSVSFYVGVGWVFKTFKGNISCDPPTMDHNVIPITTTETLGFVFDCDNHVLKYYQNGVLQYTVTDIPPDTYFPYCTDGGSTRYATVTANFGQKPLAYPSAYGNAKPLCTANLPTPAVTSPAKHFGVVTYTGTDMPQSITGLGFQPDFVWGKSRNTAGYSHHLQDVVRGWGNDLYSDLTSAEVNRPQLITSVSSTGFTLGTDEGMNESGRTYVAWCWKAGGAPVTNTDGTITSQVSANPAAGFSIVSYTGTLSPATIGHGLGVSPKLIIVKSLTVGTYDWTCQHVSLGPDKRIWLNLTSGADSLSNPWNGTAATDTVFSVGTNNETNFTDRMIAYCWAEIPGFSKFGSYTGNGSADGPFVHCGFRPRWIMVKRVDYGPTSWVVVDTARDTYNETQKVLYPNSSGAEDTSDGFGDITATGFKLRKTVPGSNANGGTYIFAAFAEAPFGGGKKTVPAKAR